jgi:hypothetical protein
MIALASDLLQKPLHDGFSGRFRQAMQRADDPVAGAEDKFQIAERTDQVIRFEVVRCEPVTRERHALSLGCSPQQQVG